MFTLKELVEEVDFEQVRSHFSLHYNGIRNVSLDAFENLFLYLLDLQPAETEIVIYIELVGDSSGNMWFEVFGRMSGAEEMLALSLFYSWSEWLGMKISEATLTDNSIHAIVTHCIFEMTYYGLTEEARRQAEERLDRSPGIPLEEYLAALDFDEEGDY